MCHSHCWADVRHLQHGTSDAGVCVAPSLGGVHYQWYGPGGLSVLLIQHYSPLGPVVNSTVQFSLTSPQDADPPQFTLSFNVSNASATTVECSVNGQSIANMSVSWTILNGEPPMRWQSMCIEVIELQRDFIAMAIWVHKTHHESMTTDYESQFWETAGLVFSSRSVNLMWLAVDSNDIDNV